VLVFQQISNNPPLCRTSLVLPATKKTYLKHTTYLENIMATAKSLTPAELDKVLSHIAQHPNADRNRLMLMIGVMAGLRVGEIAGLTLGDIIDADGKVRSEIYLASDRVKHGNARTIFLNTRIQQELTKFIASKTLRDEHLPLFSTHRGVRCSFSPNTLAQHFYWLFKNAGVKGASSHSCRKTFLTSLASQGVSVFVLASLAGHKSITTTQRYITTNDDVKRKAVELV
jgi:integrase/recombinase XerD